MSRGRRVALAIGAVVLLGSGVGYVVWVRPFLALANTGVGYVAKQMCSCIYVGERSFDSCRPDMLVSMDDIQAEVLEAPSGVRAWVPGLGERNAHYRGDLGCALID